MEKKFMMVAAVLMGIGARASSIFFTNRRMRTTRETNIMRMPSIS